MMNEYFTKYLESIQMTFVYDTDNEYDVVKNEFGEYVVLKNGVLFDDRGALFSSLRSAIAHSCLNVEFRNDDYIFINAYMSEEKIREDERKKVVDEILKCIESEYDLNYGEMLLNPRYFYELVEGFK